MALSTQAHRTSCTSSNVRISRCPGVRFGSGPSGPYTIKQIEETTAIYCAYCNEDHPPSVKFSPEHIVPVALGGPNSFMIPICESVNNKAGNEIDAPFIKMFPVNVDRFFNDLESHRGMPTLDMSGSSVIGGRDVTVQSTVKDGNKVLRIAKHSVNTTRQGDRYLVELFGDPAEIKKILLARLQGATQKGRAMSHLDGTPVTAESIDRIVAQQSIATRPSILIKLDIDGADAVRFMAKVALATGVYIAGETFGRSAIADRLRTLMRASNIDALPMPGVFWPFVQKNAAFEYFSIPGSHIIALLPDEPSVLVISLFGGNYTALVPLVEEGAPALLSVHQGRVFEILFKESRLKTWDYGQYLLRFRKTRSVPNNP